MAVTEGFYPKPSNLSVAASGASSPNEGSQETLAVAIEEAGGRPCLPLEGRGTAACGGGRV